MDLKTKVLKPLLILLVGILIGKFMGPAKKEVIEIEQKSKQQSSSVEEDKSKKIVINEITKKDGTIIKQTVIENKDTKKSSSNSSESSYKSKEVKIENRPNWKLGVAYYSNKVLNQKEDFAVTLEKRVLSELYLGISAKKDSSIGVSLSIGF